MGVQNRRQRQELPVQLSLFHRTATHFNVLGTHFNVLETHLLAENNRSETGEHCHLPKQLSDGADKDVTLDRLRRPQDCRAGQQIKSAK